MLVTTTTLQLTCRPRPAHVTLPSGARVERVTAPTPEFARWLYAVVGGPWWWADRLDWPRARWAEELERPGAEIHVLYIDGAPAGYVEFATRQDDDGTHVEITHFGLVAHAIGHGLGKLLLSHAIDAGWTLPDRHDLPGAARVWLHTCSLDGPHALANYRARGFEIASEVTVDEDRPPATLGAWASAGGPT